MPKATSEWYFFRYNLGYSLVQTEHIIIRAAKYQSTICFGTLCGELLNEWSEHHHWCRRHWIDGVKDVRIAWQFQHYCVVDHVQAFHYTIHCLLIRSCRERHQISARWGQCTNLCDVSKLCTKLFTPKKSKKS